MLEDGIPCVYPIERDDGVFFYMNNILCKTFAADGSFRPSDVFPHVEADFSLASLTHASTAAEEERDADDTLQSVRPNMDDPILNTFGVLSKGVLVDPWEGRFVDFTDSQVFTPSLFSCANESSGPSSEAGKGLGEKFSPEQSRPPRLSARHQRKELPRFPATTPAPQTLEELHGWNRRVYETGDFSRLRARACVILCSSLEPLDRSTSLETWKGNVLMDRTPFSWPYSNRFISYPALHTAVKDHVKWIFAACELPSAALDPHSDRHHSFLYYLTLLEEYRMVQKLRRPQSTYLPAGIPFPFQYQGRALGETAQSEGYHAKNPSTQRRMGEADEKDALRPPIEGDSSPISSYSMSSFSCFTGKTTMCRGKYTTIRTDLFSRCDASNVTLDIQKYIMPLRALDCKRARGMLDVIERPYLYPPKHLTRWALAWWLFRVYFRYLGLVGGPFSAQRGAATSKELLTPRQKGFEALPIECKLCPDNEYSVFDEVRRKCRDEEQQGHTQNEDPHELRPPQKSEIMDVWNYMICHQDRDRLLERLSKLEMCLEKLTSSTDKRNKIEPDLT